MNSETSDTLSRWWWPGQWLRIVSGVFIDQVWYWRNVRPLLKDPAKRVNIFIQGLLGANLVVIALLVFVVCGVRGLLGLDIRWFYLVLGSAVTSGWILGLAIIFGLDAYWFREKDLGLGVTWGATAGIFWGVVVASRLFMLSLTEAGARGFVSLPQIPDITIEVVIAMARAGLLGITLGIARNVSVGVPWPRIRCLLVCLLLGIASIGQANLVLGLLVYSITVVSIFSGMYLSGRWATRQIADDELRKRLADPPISIPGEV